jgi:hypothetical protein
MSYSNFENIIKSNIEGFEFEYNHQEWLKLEKKLPKKSFVSLRNLIVAAIAICLLSVSVIMLLKNTTDRNEIINIDNTKQNTNVGSTSIQPSTGTQNTNANNAMVSDNKTPYNSNNMDPLLFNSDSNQSVIA